MCWYCEMAEKSLGLRIPPNTEEVLMWYATGCGSDVIKQRVQEIKVLVVAKRME